METLILEIVTRGLHRYPRIDAGVTTIGRALDNDIILSDPTVEPHHLKIIRNDGDSLEFVNLAEINPVKINNRRVNSLVTEKLPVELKIGRVQARLLPRNYTVTATRSLAGDGRSGHLFGHVGWAVVLVSICLLLGVLDFYLSAYNSFKPTDLLKFVLRETVLVIGGLVLALAILERLLVNRWEIKQLVTAVSLVYLLFGLAATLAGSLEYMFSASWPITLIQSGWYLLFLPGAITLYLIHISHLKPARSILLALLIASPIALPAMLKNPGLRALLTDFSPSARYQNSLDPLNIHIRDKVSIDVFIDQARGLSPGKLAD